MSNLVYATWRGVTFYGDGSTPYFVDSLDGLGVPGGTFENLAATSGHGGIPTGVTQGPTTIQATGYLFCEPGNLSSDQDPLVAALRGQFIPRAADDETTEPLTVRMVGRTVTADVQLLRFRPTLNPATVGSGAIPWTAQWRQPDPRVFDPWVFSPATALAAPTGGLTIPRVMPFTLTEKPLGGQVTIGNTGNDPEGSPVVITLTGGQTGAVGVENLTTGVRVGYPIPLAATDVLVIDTETRTARLNGEYRTPSPWSDVTQALRAQPGTNVYRATGTADTGTPTITVAVRPRSWY